MSCSLQENNEHVRENFLSILLAIKFLGKFLGIFLAGGGRRGEGGHRVSNELNV